jgi:hypothetical protein
VQHAERLSGQRAAFFRIDTERLELAPHPAHACGQDHPAARQFLDRGDLLGGEHGRAIGKHQDRHAQADSLDRTGEKRERREHVEVASARAFDVVGR